MIATSLIVLAFLGLQNNGVNGDLEAVDLFGDFEKINDDVDPIALSQSRRIHVPQGRNLQDDRIILGPVPGLSGRRAPEDQEIIEDEKVKDSRNRTRKKFARTSQLRKRILSRRKFVRKTEVKETTTDSTISEPTIPSLSTSTMDDKILHSRSKSRFTLDRPLPTRILSKRGPTINEIQSTTATSTTPEFDVTTEFNSLRTEDATDIPVTDEPLVENKVRTLNSDSLSSVNEGALREMENNRVDRKQRDKKHRRRNRPRIEENEVNSSPTEFFEDELTTIITDDENVFKEALKTDRLIEEEEEIATVGTEPIEESEITSSLVTETDIPNVELRDEILASSILTGFENNAPLETKSINVGASIFSTDSDTNQIKPGVGKVTSVNINEPEEPIKSPEDKPTNTVDTGPSILSTLFKIFTETTPRSPLPRPNLARPNLRRPFLRNRTRTILNRPRPTRPTRRPETTTTKFENPPSRIPEGNIVRTSFNVNSNEANVLAKPDDPIEDLPSEPNIEKGFQGIRFSPPNTFENEEESNTVKPTLPPSLPNIAMIQFVAADALVEKDEKDASNVITNNKNSEKRANIPEFRRRPLPRLPSVSLKTFTTTTERPVARRPIVPIRKLIGRPLNTKPTSSDTKPTRPSVVFFDRNRNRTGTRPSILPPRNQKIKFTPRPKTTTPETTTISPVFTEEENLTQANNEDTSLASIFENLPSFFPRGTQNPKEELNEIQPSTIKSIAAEIPIALTTENTKASLFNELFGDGLISDKDNDLLSFLNGNNEDLLPRPITLSSIDSDDVDNLLIQDKFNLPDKRQPVKFLTSNARSTTIPKRTTTPLPEIPDEIKAQNPLGIDPLLSGVLQLAGCNVYGRMYTIGQPIEDLSAVCKDCRCTQVGVQCLPTC